MKFVTLSAPEIIAIEVLGGVAKRKRRPWRSGMVPFERAMVNSYIGLP